jgi:DNA-binding beta-propeller fold protein YncE
VGDEPRDVVVDTADDFAYVVNAEEDTISAIQLSDNSVALTSRTGLTPVAAAIDDTLIVLHTGDQTAALYE